MAVAAPATANVSYIDIRFQPTTGFVLDAESITDAGAEFILSGGAGTGVVDIAECRSAGAAPDQQQHVPLLPVRGLRRRCREVTVAFFRPIRYISVAVDVPDQVDADGTGGIAGSRRHRQSGRERALHRGHRLPRRLPTRVLGIEHRRQTCSTTVATSMSTSLPFRLPAGADRHRPGEHRRS
jgi:hypothetical protein